MKITTVLFIITFGLLTFINVNAATYDLQVTQSNRDADQDKYSVGSWYGTQFSYAPNDKGYFFVSQETAEVSPMGHAFDYHMTGLGVGNKWKVAENITVFGQMGYYMVRNTQGRKKEVNESLYYYLNDRFHDATGSPIQNFNEFEVENDDTFGGTIGVELNYPLSKNWTANFIFSKRIMKISETIRGMKPEWNYDATGTCWETHSNRNYSSTNMGLSVTYKF